MEAFAAQVGTSRQMLLRWLNGEFFSAKQILRTARSREGCSYTQKKVNQPLSGRSRRLSLRNNCVNSACGPLLSPDTLKSAMASPPSAKPRTLLDNQVSFKRLDTVSEIAKEAIKWGGLVAIAYFGYSSVVVLAGTTTSANIGIRLLGSLTVNRGLVALLTGSGWAYGLGQRSLRRKNIERVVPLKNELERIIDPKRTSSNLTPRGTTPPKKGKR